MPRGSGADHSYADPPLLPDGDVVDLETFLGTGGPIELVIGPGRGGFVIDRSAADPDARLLGIEVRRKWACIVDSRLAQAGQHPRARVVYDDARLALPRLGPASCIARVFIHFPDPWWKKRHRKRMVIAEPLVAQIIRLLGPGGELFVQTDVPDRADIYRRLLNDQTSLTPAGDEPGAADLQNNPYGVLSNRERRAQQDGLPVVRLRYRRNPTEG
ncbi:MAG: tRNA (guanine-N7)-methyltransferase [Deltaproteobacteria bacterium]|nr:MAG: tRNA (guanine-N7)-methyltransferase [Deltaproteobacteria bacterium]